MAGFNVSFLNPKLRKATGQDYGFLVDQISILENQLSGDGKLSPGDYDLLISQANKLAAHPGLTPDQRSNVLVKISQYQSDKSKNTAKDLTDLKRLDLEDENTSRQVALSFGNNPQIFLEARTKLLEEKLSRITDSLEFKSNAGDDTSPYESKYNETLSEYRDTLAALDAAQNYTGSGQPKTGFVSYVVTNENGEIVDLKVGRVGSQGGYSETSAVLGGLQVYGKINRKDAGKNVFVLGDKTFQAPDISIPDPSNPFGFKTPPLTSIPGDGGDVTVVQAGQFDVIRPEAVRTQSAIPKGKYAQGVEGFLYQNIGGGQYKKMVGGSAQDFNIPENDIIKIPQNIEEGISPYVVETSGPMSMYNPDMRGTSPVSGGSAPQQSDQQQGAGGQSSIGGRSRTPSPTNNSPSTQGNIFQKTFQGAKNAFSLLFNTE